MGAALTLVREAAPIDANRHSVPAIDSFLDAALQNAPGVNPASDSVPHAIPPNGSHFSCRNVSAKCKLQNGCPNLLHAGCVT